MQPASLHALPVSTLKGVGGHLAGRLARLGIYSVQDLLFHLPLRYLDRTRVTPMGGLQPNSYAVVEGEVRLADLAQGRRRSLVVRLQDTTGSVSLRFFHFSNALKQRFVPGTHLRVYGEVRRGAAGLELYHPEFDTLETAGPLPTDACLTPVYPTTEGLTQARLRKLTDQALELLARQPLPELLPVSLRRTRQQTSLSEALEFLHRPPAEANLQALSTGEHPQQQRLAFEELLAHHLSLLLLRRKLRTETAPGLARNRALEAQFITNLGFHPTKAQERVNEEITSDLASTQPMLRLVQGDVGSGKTLVAALAALTAVANGWQAAIMAPTEILAEQHKRNFGYWFEPLGIRLGWLTGRLRISERRAQSEAIASGHAQVIVGTHALFQEDVHFAALGLIIIDEQHRFGVHQRLTLRQKGANNGFHPHQLIMTATPIPRTLAMSAYADLDTSVIDELPPGRTPVTTVVISNQRRGQVLERVRLACQQGRQTYWVCTLIEESEHLAAEAAQATAETLAQLLPELRIGLVHGRLKAGDKEQVMATFKSGEIDLLVATTVIEVGVDVPKASLMIIENPERLGLAQLHQLRGRVGRGSTASHCVLLYGEPLSHQSRQRLKVMRTSNDGFYIAEQDLLLRGAGEVLGTRQTGELQFKLADLERDAGLLPAVKENAQQLIAEYPELCHEIVQRWLGNNPRYIQV